MTDIIKCLARSSIILDFNLSTDASYNKLLYELLLLCCGGGFSSLTIFLFLFFFTFTTSTSSASSESESLDDASRYTIFLIIRFFFIGLFSSFLIICCFGLISSSSFGLSSFGLSSLVYLLLF